MGFIEHLTFWQWWMISAVLIFIEFAAPGTAYFLWMGVAAGVTGLVLLLAPALTWEAQSLIFSVCTVATLITWRAYAKRHPVIHD